MESLEKFGRTLLGGSETIGFLDKKAVNRLQWFTDECNEIIVGDGIGSDLAWQNYLHSIKYRKVTVYHSGDEPRFNIGSWDTKRIFDNEASIDAECGLFLWDSYSKDTKIIMREMKWRGKPVMVYRTDIDEIKCISRGIPDRDNVSIIRAPSAKTGEKALRLFKRIFNLPILDEKIDNMLLENPHFVEDVLDEIGKLPRLYRVVLKESYVKSEKEIATTLGIGDRKTSRYINEALIRLIESSAENLSDYALIYERKS